MPRRHRRSSNHGRSGAGPGQFIVNQQVEQVRHKSRHAKAAQKHLKEEIGNLEQQVEDLQEQIDESAEEHEEELQEMRDALDILEKEKKEAKEQLKESNKLIQELEAKLDELEEERRSTLEIIKGLRESLDQLQQEKISFMSIAADAKEEIENLKRERDDAFDQLKRERDDAFDQLRNSERVSQSYERKSSVVDQQRIEIDNLKTEISRLTNGMQQLEDMCSSTKEDLEAKERISRQAVSSANMLDQDKNHLRDRLKEKDKQLRELQQSINELQEENLRVRDDCRRLTDNEFDSDNDKDRQISALENSKNALQRDLDRAAADLQKMEGQWKKCDNALSAADVEIETLTKERDDALALIQQLEDDSRRQNEETVEDLKSENRRLRGLCEQAIQSAESVSDNRIPEPVEYDDKVHHELELLRETTTYGAEMIKQLEAKVEHLLRQTRHNDPHHSLQEDFHCLLENHRDLQQKYRQCLSFAASKQVPPLRQPRQDRPCRRPDSFRYEAQPYSSRSLGIRKWRRPWKKPNLNCRISRMC